MEPPNSFTGHLDATGRSVSPRVEAWHLDIGAPGPGDDEVLARVREYVSDAAAKWGLCSLADDLALMADELVGNALKHGVAPVTLDLRRGPCDVCLVVTDAGPGWPVLREPTLEDTNGRGIALVSALAEQWGWWRRGRRKAVWCSCSCPSRTPATVNRSPAPTLRAL
ncbi:ATP-binding protein [Streptomyces sp. NPDC054796]